MFLDEMGPVTLPAGRGLDVRPHPHIGLATLTYLFEGEILHQDSLGVRQPIRPGDANWMIAGRGIVHSERTPQAERAAGHTVWGLQSWLALPQHEEERSPSFRHHPEHEQRGRARRRSRCTGDSARWPGARAALPVVELRLELA